MLEVDEGPELGAELEIMDVPLLVVKPIRDVLGIPRQQNFYYKKITSDC